MKKYIKKSEMTQEKKKKEIIENDKKNKSNEWEWGKMKNEINDKNDDNMMILR